MSERQTNGRLGIGAHASGLIAAGSRRLAGRNVLLMGDVDPKSRALVGQLAAQGANIILVYPDEAREQAMKTQREAQAQGVRCLALAASDDDAATAQRLVRRAVSQVGKMDVFIDFTGAQETAVPDLSRLIAAMRQLVR